MSRPLKSKLDKQKRGIWEGRVAVRTPSPVAGHQLLLEKRQQQKRPEKSGAGGRCSRGTRILIFSPALPFCSSGLEGSSERCRRILGLRLIYFIAGVPELLWWLQHIIWNFPPEQFFIFGNSLERESGTLSFFLSLGALVGAQLVQAQDPPRLPCQLLSQGARVCERAKPAPSLVVASVPYPVHFPLSLWGSSIERERKWGSHVCLCLFPSLLVWLHLCWNTWHLLSSGHEKVTGF